MNYEFFNHLYILLALMFAFTCFKVANCKPFKEDGEKFSWKKLIIGILRHMIVIAGSVVVFIVSSLFGADLLLIKIGDTDVTLQSAIDLTTLAILTYYGAKYIKNLSEFAGISNEIPEVNRVDEIHNSTDNIILDYNVPSNEEGGLG